MKISGSATLHAPPAQVWTALNDPAVLARTIPGCDHLEPAAPGSCRLTVTAAVASTQGTYASELAASARQEPTSFRLTATAAGAPGTLRANVLVQLAATVNGGTEVTYDADAVANGLIAGVGHRLLAGAAKQMAGEFFASVDDVLTGRAAAVPGPGGVREPQPSAAPPPTGSFLRGVLVGAAAALAAMSVARQLGRGYRRRR